MRITAKQISEHLGLSQATVSLALNDKPGVSKKTKQRVYEYIKSLNQNDRASINILNNSKNIKILAFVSERARYDDEHANYRSNILMEFSKNAKGAGYNLILLYLHNEDEIHHVIEQSKLDDTLGFLLLAADMKEENLVHFEDVNIPLVICDYEYEEILFDCAYFNNYQAVRSAMKHLYEMGHRDILYFYNTNIIYNFTKRRIAYKDFVIERDLKECMIEVGKNIDLIYDFVVKYIKDGGMTPTAILSENYAISIATIKALEDCGYKINEDISIIGIDELPSYVLTNFKFTHINVLHESKSRLAINRLFDKIESKSKEIIRIVVENKFVEGDSVKKLV